ncbi:unnamed protein product [Enterobius vermicularis]|uniref:B3_4 domain-containing protein n=1 Tax=Enterobius vermicularis TaxID=51028 RepID=A0A0N4VHV4_ENTVE|nr:unnamed protein product [Enterobius vermicularis]
MGEKTINISEEEYLGSPLNFIDLSQVSLTTLFPSVSNLGRLSSLILRSNKLKEIPEEIGTLSNLKVLDLSTNQIHNLPQSINLLKCLSSLNLSHNKIQDLPDLSELCSLQVLDLSHNAISVFPTGLPTVTSKLQTLLLSRNKIESIPNFIKEIGGHLKTLDLSENNLSELPLPLAFLPKLKVLSLHSNRFANKRFQKLTEDKRHLAPSMVDYLKRELRSSENVKNKEDSGGSLSDKLCSTGVLNLEIRFGSDKVSVTRMEPVVEIRPHIACCLLRNVMFDAEKLKLFFSIQNRLHDTICDHRNSGTIGTHDFKAIYFPLKYTALEPDELKGKTSISTETETPELAEINSRSEVTTDTEEVFVEVTSAVSQSTCRNIMEHLIEEIINNGFSSALVVEQIKIFQDNGNLLIAYPGKLDLQLKNIAITRRKVTENEP